MFDVALVTRLCFALVFLDKQANMFLPQSNRTSSERTVFVINCSGPKNFSLLRLLTPSSSMCRSLHSQRVSSLSP